MEVQKVRKDYTSLYYTIAIVVVLMAGSAAIYYTYRIAGATLEHSLLKNATTIAYSIDESQLKHLTGTEADLSNPTYQALKTRLIKIRSARPDIRFVYFTGYRDGEPFFYVDSEPEDSLDLSPPGQIYFEGSEAFRNPFIKNDPTPQVEPIYQDRWGTWLTAIIPLVDPTTGNVIALIGMDMDASDYFKTVYFYTGFPVGVTLFIIIMLLVGYVLRRREQKFLDFKAELVSIISQEIRTPLNSIAWIADGLLKNPAGLSESIKSDVTLVEKQARELSLIVSDFLDTNTIEKASQGSITTKRFSPLQPIKEAAAHFEAEFLSKGLDFNIDPSLSTDISILGDDHRFKRMFANLISNAVKYSKPGGRIIVAATQNPGKVVLSIKDQGIGVPPEDLNRIFEGYYRAENARAFTTDGSGLGLRYVQQIATLYGGRVWVESEVETGSTFYVEFPS